MEKIKINARTDMHPDFRPYTVRGAVASFASKLKVGQKVVVDSVVGPMGEDVTLSTFRMNLNSLKAQMEGNFITRKSNEGLCMVFRIE